MNLTDAQQRAIYEFLYKELQQPWTLRPAVDRDGNPASSVAEYELAGRTFAKILPPLDMSTWHRDVEKMLAKEGIRVDVVCLSESGKPLHQTTLTDEDIDSPTAFQRWYGEGATVEDACYAALLGYIKSDKANRDKLWRLTDAGRDRAA